MSVTKIECLGLVKGLGSTVAICSGGRIFKLNRYCRSAKGDPLKGIPYDKYTFRATYEADIFGEPVWITAVHSYTGDFSDSGIQRALDRVPSRETTNISASWWSDDYKTSVRAYISNIFDNKNIENLLPHDIVNLGISQVPEGRRIFSRLTVEDNLRLGASVNEKGKNFDEDSKDVYDLFPVLKDRLLQRGGTLSGGEQQMLAIGRAMMARPKMLLLAEPSLGIAPKLVNQIFASIKNINKEKKVTVFLVEQNAKKALELADRGYVLVNGKISLEGAGKDLLNNPDVQAAYLEGGK